MEIDCDAYSIAVPDWFKVKQPAPQCLLKGKRAVMAITVNDDNSMYVYASSEYPKEFSSGISPPHVKNIWGYVRLYNASLEPKLQVVERLCEQFSHLTQDSHCRWDIVAARGDGCVHLSLVAPGDLEVVKRVWADCIASFRIKMQPS